MCLLHLKFEKSIKNLFLYKCNAICDIMMFHVCAVEMICPDEEVTMPEDETRVRRVKKSQCKGCDRVISNFNMKKHTNTYWGLRASSCAMGHLAKTKENTNPVRRTSPTSQSKQQKLHECGMCKKVFDNVPKLRLHMLSAHAKNVVFSCHQCDIKFHHIKQLRKHQMSVHGWGRKTEHTETEPRTKKRNNLSVAKCEVCKQEFISEYCLMLHVKRFHPKREPLTCEHCQFHCKSKQKLAMHMLNLHHDPYKHNLDLFFE